jgi:hypothetical protein
MDINGVFGEGSFDIIYYIPEPSFNNIEVEVNYISSTIESFTMSESGSHSNTYNYAPNDLTFSYELGFTPATPEVNGEFKINSLHYTERYTAPYVLSNVVLCTWDNEGNIIFMKD